MQYKVLCKMIKPGHDCGCCVTARRACTQQAQQWEQAARPFLHLCRAQSRRRHHAIRFGHDHTKSTHFANVAAICLQDLCSNQPLLFQSSRCLPDPLPKYANMAQWQERYHGWSCQMNQGVTAQMLYYLSRSRITSRGPGSTCTGGTWSGGPPRLPLHTSRRSDSLSTM
jgi:hypothetical protein